MKKTNQIAEIPGHMWLDRKKIEQGISYDLKHSVRLYVHDCYHHARAKDRPFNLVIKFDFERHGDKEDVKQIRDLAHRIRMYFRMHDIELLMIWSRHVAWKSPIEEGCLLIHIPEKNMEQFIKTATGWRKNLEFICVGYGEDFDHLGTKCNIIDYMTRAMCNESKVKDLGAIREDSDFIHGYRTFCSWNLRPINRHKITKAKP